MVRILHLVGSCETERLYQVSLLYAKACQHFDEFKFIYAVIHPSNKMWTFTSDLTTLEDESQNITMNLLEALKHISILVQPDVVIHHMYCEEGSVFYRALIEMLAIPLVGSPSSVVSIAKNKAFTRGVLSNTNVQLPKAVYLNPRLIMSNAPEYSSEKIRTAVGFPCVVKAACVDDSLGVFLVKSEKNLKEAISKALSLDNDVIIEEFIPGDEIRCGILEDENGTLQVLPMFKYDVISNNIRSTLLKYEYDDDGSAHKSSQSRINVLKSTDKGDRWQTLVWENVSNAALQAYNVLNLRDFGLFDFRVHEETGEAYFLEVNLFCSFGSESVMNVMAREQDYTDKDLLRMVVNKAIARQ